MSRHLTIMTRLAFLVTASLTLAAAAAVSRHGFAAPTTPDAQPRTPVVAELFTSEGCSSCPPADRLLETLLRDQPVDGAFIVTLSEHVDYWDHQGWKDPFSSARFTERQESYGRHFGRDSIYTPQLVIDGTTEVVGSDDRAVRRAVAAAAKVPKASLRVALTAREGRALDVTVEGDLPSGAEDVPDVWVALTEDDLTSEVARGENARRTLHHVSVVRSLVAATTKQSGTRLTSAASLAMAPTIRRDKMRVVAIAQSRKTGRVLGIGWNPT